LELLATRADSRFNLILGLGRTARSGFSRGLGGGDNVLGRRLGADALEILGQAGVLLQVTAVGSQVRVERIFEVRFL